MTTQLLKDNNNIIASILKKSNGSLITSTLFTDNLNLNYKEQRLELFSKKELMIIPVIPNNINPAHPWTLKIRQLNSQNFIKDIVIKEENNVIINKKHLNTQ